MSAFAQIRGSAWTPKAPTFNVQWPYTVAEDTRYWFSNNIYHCLVYSNDAPFKAGSTTLPRTEQRFTPDYTNGEIQYQASLMAVPTENSYCVFQIHTGDAQSSAFGSTTFMLFWFTSDGGSVHDYSGTELAKNLGNQWFQLNVDHNLVTRTIKVWINQKLVWTQQDNGAGDFYFKDGVYEQSHSPTLQMDTYITNILMWVSSGTNPPAPPTGLNATPGVGQIGLAWNPSVDASNYNIKRSAVNNGPYAIVGSTTNTNYADTGVTGGVTCYYVATAVDSFGESANSAQVSAKAPLAFIHSAVLKSGEFLFSGNGGLPGGSYYVFASSNLTVAPSLWSRVATNTFDGVGGFAFINPQPLTDPQKFYLLQMH